MIQAVHRLDDFARSRLYRLDDLLEQLELLNLAESRQVPQDVAAALQDAGVRNPSERSVTELIDQVFELQEPILSVIASFSRKRPWRPIANGLNWSDLSSSR